MPKDEKTVFISYRRTNGYAARSIFQDLRNHGYDVYFDIESTGSGEFGRIILEQVAARAHFVLVLAPRSLDRTVDPSDWMRQEIEQAIKLRRNIVNVMIDGFSFKDQDLSSYGEVAKISRFNGLNVYNEYFEAAMKKLREQFLKQPGYITIKPPQATEKKIPDTAWRDLSSSDYEMVVQRLREAGELGNMAALFIQTKKLKLGFYKQNNFAGIRWTPSGKIILPSGVKLDNPYILSSIMHEVFHMKQSVLMRLSMRGELLAWQYQERAYFEITGENIGASGQALDGTRKHWDELMQLSADSREDLKRSQDVTRNIVPTYRSYCLPLNPLHQEIQYYLRRGKFKKAFDAYWNLVRCK